MEISKGILKYWRKQWDIGGNIEIFEELLRYWKKYWTIGRNIEILEDILRYWRKYWDIWNPTKRKYSKLNKKEHTRT